MAGRNRYSTLVAWAKVVLPLIALALLSTLFLFSRTPNPQDALPYANIDLEQLAREQRLSRPRFAGTLADGRPVTLTSDSAVQQSDRPNRIHLDNVQTDLVMNADEVLTIFSDTGDFDLVRQIIELVGGVRLLTTSGYLLLSEAIDIAMDQMRLSSPGAVELSGPELWLEAGAMELTGGDGQALFSFTGGVRLLYLPAD
jgi:lipopolysaccharide export system protein LptC